MRTGLTAVHANRTLQVLRKAGLINLVEPPGDPRLGGIGRRRRLQRAIPAPHRVRAEVSRIRGPRGAPSIKPDGHGFDDLVALEAFFPALAAETGILDPAERRVGAADGEGVDPDHPAFDEVADEVGAAAVLGEGEGGEAEGQAVGLARSPLRKCRTGVKTATGPNGSSFMISARRWGRRREASAGRRSRRRRVSPPAMIRAPLALASCTKASIASGRRWLASGPIFTPSSSPLPVFTFWVRSAKPVMNAS